MRYYAQLVEDEYRGPIQPAFDTDIYSVTDFYRLRELCEKAAAENPEHTYLILDEDSHVVGVEGWLIADQMAAIDDEEVREQARMEQSLGTFVQKVRYQLDAANVCMSPRQLFRPLAQAIAHERRGWIAVFELEADRGYYGGVYLGMPALRYRLAARVIEPLLACTERLLRRHAGPPRTGPADDPYNIREELSF